MLLWTVIFFITVNGQTVRVQSPAAMWGFVYSKGFCLVVSGVLPFILG